MLDRIIDRCVIREDGCISWEGAANPDGRPHFGFEGKTLSVLQVLYEHFRGAIPREHLLHHECEHKWCVNPWCVRPMTPAAHVELHGIHLAGSIAAGQKARSRTHCKHGHEFTEENTVWYYGWRSCRQCRAAASRRDYHRKQDA
jgi:hypothetical protein